MGCYCEFLIPVGFCSTVPAKNAVSHKPFPLFSTRGAELSCHISGYVTSTPSINSLRRGLKTVFTHIKPNLLTIFETNNMGFLGCWFIPNSSETLSTQQLLLAQEDSFLMGQTAGLKGLLFNKIQGKLLN